MKNTIKLLTGGALLLVLSIILSGCDAAMSSGKAATARGRIEKSVNKLAAEINPERSYTPKEIFSMMESTLNDNPEVFGAAWAIPDAQGKTADIYYIYRDEQTFVTRTDKGMDTASPLLAWFRTPYRIGRGGWSHPYNVDDNFGNRLSLVTYCALVRKGNAAPSAIIACDYLIRRISSPNNSVIIDSPKQ